tara:strand:+ start:59 stop:418 length:360 start_codon:yes stop_codon:yes gene_type:complete
MKKNYIKTTKNLYYVDMPIKISKQTKADGSEIERKQPDVFRVFYSYKTPVAVLVREFDCEDFTVSQNYWSKTTACHLTAIEDFHYGTRQPFAKGKRQTHEDFRGCFNCLASCFEVDMAI